MSKLILVPIDPALSPRQQLQPLLLKLPAFFCSRHPDVMRSLNVDSSIRKILRLDRACSDLRPLEWQMSTSYRLCNECRNWSPFRLLPGCARLRGSSQSIYMEPETPVAPL